MPVACEHPDLEDWTQIEDSELRKKIQNRLSQRRHREKIRKQNGTAVNANSTHKARTETASAPPGSSTVSRSASPQASSSTSAQGGPHSNDDGTLLDTWDDQADDDLALDADWNEFTFLDSPSLETDALFSFSSNLQTSQLPPPTFPLRTHQQLSSLSNDSSRPCSCGAHAAKALLANNATRLSQYHALSILPQLSSPAPVPSMSVSETPLSSAPSPVRVPHSPGRACNTALTLSTRTTRAASERANRPKMQRTSTSDSAIGLSSSTPGLPDDRRSFPSDSSSRKRSRTTTVNDSEDHLSPANLVQLELQGTGDSTSAPQHSAPQQDDNAILQRVSEVLAELMQDDGPAMKRQKLGVQEAVSPRSEGQVPHGGEEGKIGTLPKIRRGTLPGGGEIIVIVMQP